MKQKVRNIKWLYYTYIFICKLISDILDILILTIIYTVGMLVLIPLFLIFSFIKENQAEDDGKYAI
jgi:hypothetical protein